MKFLFAIVFAASTFVTPIENNAIATETPMPVLEELTAENEMPRYTKVCWVIFGAEVICMTVEESFMGEDVGGDIRGKATFDSRSNTMTLKLPTKSSGTMIAQETISFKVSKTEERMIRKGTKISVRQGVARLKLGND